MINLKLRFNRKFYAVPYALFMLVFVVLPLIILIYYSFTDSAGNFTFNNFLKANTKMANLGVSIGIAALNTLICLVIAYPLCYFLSTKKYNKSAVLVLLFVVPMWINFMLRTLSVKAIFTGMNIEPSWGTVVVGMVYDFLPFMILPLYTTMSNIDRSLTEAASDLGAGPFTVFFKTVVPLSLPGAVSGILMVFMPGISFFAIAKILGSANTPMFGGLIDDSISAPSLWHSGSALSVILLALVGITVLIGRLIAGGDKEVAARGGLW